MPEMPVPSDRNVLDCRFAVHFRLRPDAYAAHCDAHRSTEAYAGTPYSDHGGVIQSTP